MKNDELKQIIFKGKNFQSIKNQIKKQENDDNIPKKGICVKVESS